MNWNFRSPPTQLVATNVKRGDCKSVRRSTGWCTEPVDAINICRVSAGHFAYFRVVSRTQTQCFRSSNAFLCRVRFPAAPPKWVARAISPGEVSFPINHTWPSQAAFTWGEVFIYYIDHLPQVEEFGEHTWGLSMSAISYAEIGRHDVKGPSGDGRHSAPDRDPPSWHRVVTPRTHELNPRLLTPSTPLDVSAGRATSSRVGSGTT